MFFLLLACAPPPLSVEVEPDPSGLSLFSNLPLSFVEVVDPAGIPVVRRQVLPPKNDLILRASLSPGPYSVHLRAGDQSAEVGLSIADPGPATVRIEAPLGQGTVSDGSELRLPDGYPVRVGLIVDAHRDLTVRTGLSPDPFTLKSGERRVFVAEVGLEGLHTWVELEGVRRPIDLSSTRVPLATLKRSLLPRRPVLPARGDGTRDSTVPANRIALPAPWWEALLDRWNLGFRPRDDLAPRTHIGLALNNPTASPVHALVTAQVQVEGRPHPAFRPRTRDAMDLTDVRRLVRVPAHSSVNVALPLYLDRSAVPGPLLADVVLQISTLGSSAVLHELHAPLSIERGSPWASALFGLGGVSAFLGGLFGLLRFRFWIDGPTRNLTTVAVFGALSFVVGTASQVVGIGLASVLGPFAPFLLGLVDDAVRVCLLATLLSLVPRQGVVSLALLIGWLMRAIALGAAHPVDALYLGASIFWFEGMIFLTGLTRGAPLSVPRLWLGLALPNGILTGFGLAVSVVVYRLFYADAYVMALLLGPGLLYPAMGCVLAVPFAASLRRVAP